MKLQSLLDSYQKEYSKDLEGSVQRCLVTGLSKKANSRMQGRTECNRVVNFDFQNTQILGTLIDIKIDKALAHSLQGHIFSQEHIPPT